MKSVYPAIFIPDGKWFVVNVPDLDICTQGEGLAGAIDAARDAICFRGIEYQDNGKELPPPSDITSLQPQESGFTSLIDCDLETYRKKLDTRPAKKNCTLPAWLNREAEDANLDFSAVLQEALTAKLKELKEFNGY